MIVLFIMTWLIVFTFVNVFVFWSLGCCRGCGGLVRFDCVFEGS